jgi:hypothetical protein
MAVRHRPSRSQNLHLPSCSPIRRCHQGGIGGTIFVLVAAALIALLLPVVSVGVVALFAVIVMPALTIKAAVCGLKRMPSMLRRIKVIETLRSAVTSAPRASASGLLWSLAFGSRDASFAERPATIVPAKS